MSYCRSRRSNSFELHTKLRITRLGPTNPKEPSGFNYSQRSGRLTCCCGRLFLVWRGWATGLLLSPVIGAWLGNCSLWNSEGSSGECRGVAEQGIDQQRDGAPFICSEVEQSRCQKTSSPKSKTVISAVRSTVATLVLLVGRLVARTVVPRALEATAKAALPMVPKAREVALEATAVRITVATPILLVGRVVVRTAVPKAATARATLRTVPRAREVALEATAVRSTVSYSRSSSGKGGRFILQLQGQGRWLRKPLQKQLQQESISRLLFPRQGWLFKSTRVKSSTSLKKLKRFLLVLWHVETYTYNLFQRKRSVVILFFANT